MAKSGAPIKELQRRLVRLTRLDGRLLLLTDGAWLIWPEYVRDSRPLVQALRSGGGLSSALLRAALQLQCEPLLVTTRWLAAAQRDLLSLQKTPDVLANIQAAARRFRSLPQPTPAWLAERQQRLDELTAQLHATATTQAAESVAATRPAQAAPQWFRAVGALVRTLRGKHEEAALHELWARSVSAPRPAQLARRRILGLVERLGTKTESRNEEPALQSFLDEAAREARSLLGNGPRTLGRAQLRRLVRLVRRVVFWPAAPSEAHMPELDGARLRSLGSGRALLTELATPLLADLPRSRDPAHRDRLLQVVAHYALLFPLDADFRAVNVLDCDWLEQQLGRATELAPHGLTMTQALALLKSVSSESGHRAGQRESDLTRLARHSTAGVPLDLLLPTCQLGYAAEVCEFTGEAAALRAYCEWVCRLAPLYKQSGRKLELSPAMLTRFHALREPSVAFLAHCLVSSAADAAPRAVAQKLTLLDAAVGLCGRVPQRAATLVSALTTWPSGAGRARFPEFAAWLADDALFDRYLHLATLAGEPAELSRTLLRDFSQAERLLRERTYLTSLSAPDEKQLLRLRAAEKTLSSGELPGPSWTRRRLIERTEDLQGRALQRQLDIALRDVLHKGFGVAPATLTPAWRDAVRFYLLTEDNSAHLGTLLRFAALHPGVSPARSLAQNQRWLQRASQRIDVDAWLAPRRAELELDGQRFTLASAEDPIEVLRMGIPFGTCLSIEHGCNAAAAVLNAMDANKRVFYLRDRRGVIVGRKLLAISADWGLLGYELYLSLDARHRPAVTAAVLSMCEELGRAARIPLLKSGVPESLHEGFWYDDGPQPFVSPVEPEVTAYCRTLGQTVPTPRTPNLTAEAAQWQARESGAVISALAALRVGRQALCDEELGAWIVDRLGLGPAEQTARTEHGLRPFVLRRAAALGAERLLQAAGAWEGCDAYEVRQLLCTLPPSARMAAALIASAERAPRRGERPDDHGLGHLTFSDLEPSLAVTPVAQILVLCDRLQPLWDWFVAEQDCQSCRESGEEAVLRAVRQSFSNKPDPSSVIACLRSRRASALAQRVALHVAAAFPLIEAEKLQPTLSLTVPPLAAGAPEGLRAVQTLGLRQPALQKEPDFLAAVLRQSPRPLRLALPIPQRAPFEELSDLLRDPAVRAQLADSLAPFVSGPADLKDYHPSSWELYYHRRHETPLRKRITRALQAAGTGVASEKSAAADQKLLSLLADLGDLKTLTELSTQCEKGTRSRHIRAALERANTVAWQVALDGHFLDAPLHTLGKRAERTADTATIKPELRDIPDVVDHELLCRVLSALERNLYAAAPVDAEYVWALYALTSAPLGRAQLKQILTLLVQARHGAFDHIELWYVNWFLNNKTSWELPEVSPDLVVELWQEPELRRSLAAALANGSQWAQRYQLMTQLAQQRGLLLDGLLELWLPLHIERDVDGAVYACGMVAELELLIDVALAHGKPAQWLAIYQALACYAEAACFLKRLRSAPPKAEDLEQLKSLVGSANRHDPDDVARAGWLTASLAELQPG